MVVHAQDSPSRELLESYSYRPPLFSSMTYDVPGPATSPTAATAVPLLAPEMPAHRLSDYEMASLEDAIARERPHRSRALFIWDMIGDKQLQVLGTPNAQPLAVPWNPMMASSDAGVSTDRADSLSAKLELRVPLLQLLW
jgi:hypothetical protein